MIRLKSCKYISACFSCHHTMHAYRSGGAYEPYTILDAFDFLPNVHFGIIPTISKLVLASLVKLMTCS